ncbi:MAG: sigma-70 family RNA polymerase sigma factor [Planctomycetes bacterium]|nr:sigma-70 family RNA polymerase sigma factor [Planctomycetota bacterium]
MPPQPDPSNPGDRTSTRTLLTQAQTGDEAAIAQLYERYAPRVRGLAAVRMGNTLLDLHDVEDIVQEALLTALRSLHQFEPAGEGAFIGWLAKIVESRIQDARRRGDALKRGGGTVRRRADLGITTISVLGAADPGHSPSQTVAHGEIDSRLERALLGLGSPLREIVYQHLVLQMDHKEIATGLGLASADSSRAMLNKALALLRRRLQEPPAS